MKLLQSQFVSATVHDALIAFHPVILEVPRLSVWKQWGACQTESLVGGSDALWVCLGYCGSSG